MITITPELTNHDAVRKMLWQLPSRFNDILADSVNKTALIIRNEAKKKVPQEWGVSKDRDILINKINKASAAAGEMVAQILLQKSQTPLFRMSNVSPRSIMGGRTQGGVIVAIAGQNKTFKHSFIAKMRSGHKGIFERVLGSQIKKNPSREQITELYTTSIARMAKSEKTNAPQELQEHAQKVFEKEFVAQCEAWLNAMGAR
jgi:hypothetical protein